MRPSLSFLGGVHVLPASAANEVTTAPKRLALLAWLAAHVDRGPVQRGEVAAVLWPERTERQARSALRQIVYEIRRGVGVPIITSTLTTVQFAADIADCDVIAFDRAVAQGDDHEVARLYRGDLLQGLIVPGSNDFMDWLERARSRQRRAAHASVVRLAHTAVRRGEWQAVLEWARRAERLAGEEPSASDDLSSLIAQAERALRAAAPSMDAVRATSAFVRPAVTRAGHDGDAEVAIARGLHHLWRFTPVDLARAQASFEEAVALAPTSAAAYAGLGKALLLRAVYADAEAATVLPDAARALDTAMALDPNSTTSDAVRAIVAVLWDRDVAWAEALIARAQALSPSDHEPWLAELLYLRAPQGDADGALRAARECVARAPVSASALATVSLVVGFFDAARADAYAREALDLDPTMLTAHWALASTASWAGQHDDALARSDLVVRLTGGHINYRAAHGVFLAVAGRRMEARAAYDMLAAQPTLSPTARYYRAVLCA
ncbi:MAG: hypothetical protein MUF00_09050, partial [Gemmatimonadaceae bacterium]|nr:hypothetical protein [Gemmatimonadaceae bacterium]